MMKTIYLVAGARPNFMQIAPIVRALQAHGGLAFKIIHTGQHYDRDMNDVFFEELNPTSSWLLEAEATRSKRARSWWRSKNSAKQSGPMPYSWSEM